MYAIFFKSQYNNNLLYDAEEWLNKVATSSFLKNLCLPGRKQFYYLLLLNVAQNITDLIA